MTLSQQEYDAIMADDTKSISGNIAWERRLRSPAREFTVDIDSGEGHPLFLKGWYNPYSGKLSYAIIHRGVGRIYGLDLGADHQNPDGRFVGEKHKNYWKPDYRDKWAYVPPDITETWDRPADVWTQFCDEANLTHLGMMIPPIVIAQRGFLP